MTISQDEVNWLDYQVWRGEGNGLDIHCVKGSQGQEGYRIFYPFPDSGFRPTGYRNTLSALSILMEFGVMPEVQSIGFYCGDSKISQKYRGDTVTLKVLLFSTILLPLFTICSVESSCYGTRGSSKRAWWPQALAWYREYLSGFLIVVFLTCVAKVLVGEPRPHFLDTCRPFQALNCTSGKFIASYTCTNSEVGSVKMRDASKSFPSAHSALSVYLFIFCAWYLQRRMVGVSAVLVAWLQVVYLVWALVCCVTRVTDHRHHWWDVLAGVALGTVFGVYTNETVKRSWRKLWPGVMNNDDDPIEDDEDEDLQIILVEIKGKTSKMSELRKLPSTEIVVVYNFCCNFQVSTYRHLHTTAKIPDKSSNHLFKGRLLSSSSDTTAQGLADVTAT
ncbi:hypothetical protein J6590_041098 [Homalodisca vitripennis]|nr:hypothetical protein J6590_041098 [Homalodisca vitripennis]